MRRVAALLLSAALALAGRPAFADAMFNPSSNLVIGLPGNIFFGPFGGGGPPYTCADKLDFSNTCNSMYINTIAGI